MRIVSWNLSCFRKQGAFRYALDHLDADLYFFQECHHPLTYIDKAEHERFVGKYVWEPTENGWGNCIVSMGKPVEAVNIETKFKGRVLAGKLGGMDIVLVDLHVPITDNQSRHNLKSMIEEIRPLQKNMSAVVAGDLNFGRYFDRKDDDFCQEWLWKLLGENHLISCFHKFHEKEKQTFRSSRKEAECMIDYIFVTKDLEAKVGSCDVFKNNEVVDMSDHNPVFAEVSF